MAARSNTDSMEKEFEYYEITWEIENYFLVSVEQNWKINGPKISVGNPPTDWKMYLKSFNGGESIQLALDRLDPGTRIVRVNWRVILKNMCGATILCNKDLESYGVSTKFCCQETYLIKKFEKKLNPVEDTLIIFCQLIVGHESTRTFPEGPLSKPDIIRNFLCFHMNNECDFVIKNKCKNTQFDRTIYAHTKVLYSRSSTFKRLIEEGKNSIMLELDDCALLNVISYFYTGNIRFILSGPTISLYECLLHLDVKTAHKYYVPNFVKLKTNLDVQNYEIKWVIENISGRTESTTITSPVWNDSISATSWELQLQLERVDEYMCMSISAESNGNVNLMAVGCAAVNCNNIVVSKSHKLESVLFEEDSDVMFQANLFQIKMSQMLSLLPDNKLYIIFKIQTLLSDTVSKRESRSRLHV